MQDATFMARQSHRSPVNTPRPTARSGGVALTAAVLAALIPVRAPAEANALVTDSRRP